MRSAHLDVMQSSQAKPITFAVAVAIATSVGFIAGFEFNEAYQVEKKDLISSTVHEISDLESLMFWYQEVLRAESMVKLVDQAVSSGNVEALRERSKAIGLRKIERFREKLAYMEERVPNPGALRELERSVEEIEPVFQ